MLRDIAGSLWGVLIFAVPLLAPGYGIARLTDLCSFRRAGLREQFAWSLALSFASTILLVGLVWAIGVTASGWVLAALALITVFFAIRNPPRLDLSRRAACLAAAIALAWALVVVLSLVDIGVGNRLWMSVTSYDHSVRTAFVGAVMRTGVPPTNPLYWPGSAAPMRYYYFWYVTCAVVAKLAHISARQALIASCVWPLAGVGAMLALFGRYLLGWRAQQLSSRWRMAMLLLAVTGLDLLATVGTVLSGGPLEGDMEWWSVDQVTSWADTFLWVPHHAAALVCALLSLLLIWLCAQERRALQRLAMVYIAGLSFASAFGLSTYIAAGTALLFAPWLVWKMFSARRERHLASTAVAATTAALLLIPFTTQLLRHGPADPHASSHVLSIGLRRIIDPAVLNGVAPFHALRVAHPTLETNLAALLLLIPGYITELGFFGLALIVATRGIRQRSEGERTLVFWVWSGLFAVTFVRSQVLSSNDYGFRAVLLAQFVLVPLAVLALERSSGWTRRALLTLAVVGVFGSVFQVAILRSYLTLLQPPTANLLTQLAERNAALRDAFAAFDTVASPDARIQYDTTQQSAAASYIGFAQMLQANRQIVNADTGCDTSFGGSIAPCAHIQQVVATLYTHPPATTAETIALCSSVGIDDLVITRWDSAWSNPQSWVWSLPVVVDRPDARILQCKAPQ